MTLSDLHLLPAFLNDIFHKVVHQLTRFQLAYRVARSLCYCWASFMFCCCSLWHIKLTGSCQRLEYVMHFRIVSYQSIVWSDPSARHRLRAGDHFHNRSVVWQNRRQN